MVRPTRSTVGGGTRRRGRLHEGERMKLRQLIRRTMESLVASTMTVALARLEGPAEAAARAR